MSRFTSTLLVALIPLTITGCVADSGAGEAPETSAEAPTTEAPAEWTVHLLDGFPEQSVPLFKPDLIDTVYYSVRNDPQWAAVEGGLRSMHHVVYQTAAAPAEVLDHYLALMDTTEDDDPSDGDIEGTIGKYAVQVNTTEQSSYNAVYVTVDLPQAEVTPTNPFYADYPTDLVQTPAEFVFFEEKYSEYLYRGTDMAFWRQFDVADRDADGDPDLSLEDIYTWSQARYGDRPGFAVNRESRQITWNDAKYRVIIAFYEDGTRGVLELGWDWVK